MRSTSTLALATLTLTLAAAACDDSPTSTREGRLTIQLTDAPGDLDEAFIRVERLVLHGVEDEAGGRLEITPENPGWIDLLALSGGNVMNLASQVLVPNGTYTDLRVVIADAYVRLNDGRVFATQGATLPSGVTADGQLRCPSCAQSGFKVMFTNGGVTVEDDATVLIDFDVARTFGHEAGRSGQWIMHPVLRATARTVQLGSITGGVATGTAVTLPACGGAATTLAQFRPIAVMGTDTVTATVGENGEFRFSHLLPGTWTLSILPEITFTNGQTLTFAATPTPATVVVEQGQSVSANYVINSAVCAAG